MKVWTTTTFGGHYPVGTAAIIVAPSEEAARILMDKAIIDAGLSKFQGKVPYSLEEIDTTIESAVILLNGDY